jgi:hypothetical protein
MVQNQEARVLQKEGRDDLFDERAPPHGGMNAPQLPLIAGASLGAVVFGLAKGKRERLGIRPSASSLMIRS